MSMNRDAQAGQLIERTEPTSSGEVAAQTPRVGSTAEAAPFGGRSSNRSRPSVELHIEELVLNGFEPAHRYMIGDAVERELTRLVTEQGAPPAITQGGEIEHGDGGVVEISAGSNAETIGMQLAKAIYGGFDQ